MSAVITPPPVVENPEMLDFLLASVKVTSSDFGEISQKQSVLKTFTIKNVGTATTNNSIVLTGSPSFALTYNICNKSLAKTNSCTFKITFSGAGNENSQSATVTYGAFSLALTGKIITPAIAQTDPASTLAPNIVLLENNNPIVAPKNLGTFSGTQSTIVNLNVKNTGTLASQPLTAGLSDSANFQMLYDACSNQTLAVNGSCMMKVVFGANGKQVGTYSTNVNVDTKSGSLNAAVELMKCPDGQHLEGLTNCVTDFIVCRTIMNGQGTQTWNGTDYGICKASSCNEGYLLNTALNKCESGGDPCNGVAIGGTCLDGLVFVGVMGNKKVSTPPGNCTNKYSPTCSISNPPLLKTKAKAIEYCQNLHYSYSKGFELLQGFAFGGQTPGLYNNMLNYASFGMSYGDSMWAGFVEGRGNVYFGGDYQNFATDPFSYQGVRCFRHYVPGCDDGFHNENGYCISDSRACTIPKGTGTQSWDGTSWGACNQNLACQSGFNLQGGSCLLERTCAGGTTLQGDICVNSSLVCGASEYKTAEGVCAPKLGDPCGGKTVGEICADGLVFVGNSSSGEKIQATPGFCTNNSSPTCSPTNPELLKTRANAQLYCSGLNYVYSSGFELLKGFAFGGETPGQYYNMLSYESFGLNYEHSMWVAFVEGRGNVYFGGDYQNFATDPNSYQGTRCFRYYVPTCDAGTHNEGGNCVSDTRACTIPKGTGTQSFNGSVWGPCNQNLACQSGYDLINGHCIIQRVCGAGESFDEESDLCVGGSAPVVCDSNSYLTESGCQTKLLDPCLGKSVGEMCDDGLLFMGTYDGFKVQATPGFCTNKSSPTCSPSNPELLKTKAAAIEYCAGLNYIYSSGYELLQGFAFGGQTPGLYYNMLNYESFGMDYSDSMWAAFVEGRGNVYFGGDYQNFATDPFSYQGARCFRYYTPTCGEGTHNEGPSCVSNTRTCTIPNGSGTQEWNGSWGSCSNISCSSTDYLLTSDGQHCVIVRTCPGQTFNPDLDICE